MRKANSFQIEKVQPQGVAYLLLNFILISARLLLIKMFPIKKCVLEISVDIPHEYSEMWHVPNIKS